MLWLHPLLLAGLATLTVPILIHYLMKLKGVRTPFSTLRFFAKAQGSRQRKKIRHWPILLLRLLMLALLVAAFARPFWPASPSEPPPKAAQRAVVIVLDRSASMNTRITDAPDETRWSRAVEAAKKTFNDMSANDQAALVTDAEQAEITANWGTPAAALLSLEKLGPTNEAGQIADGLQVAGTLLDQAPADSQKELVLISDLQKSSCRDIDSAPLPIGTNCSIVPLVGSAMTTNSAVTQITRKDTISRSLKVEFHNYSAQPLTGASFDCIVSSTPATPQDAKSYFSQKVDIDADGLTEVPLRDLPVKPGWQYITVDLKSEDQLPGDNNSFAAVNIPEPISVLVVEPDQSEKVYRQSSYFVASALDPDAEDTSGTGSHPFAVTVVDPANLISALATAKPHGVVVLPPLPDVPKGLGAALTSYVSAGGGLLGWVGGRMDSIGYNTELEGLWPAHFISAEASPNEGAGGAWQLGWWNAESPLFGLFRQPGHGDLTLTTFSQRMKLSVDDGADVLARFADQAPFLLSRNVGQGRVLLVNTTPDTRWSDWPRHKTFLPMVQQMASYLAQSGKAAGFTLAPSLAPTRQGEFDLGAAPDGGKALLLTPDGKTIPVQTDDEGVLRNLDLENTGCYEVCDAQNKTLAAFSVNFPASESTPESYAPNEFNALLQFNSPANSAPIQPRLDLSTAGRHEIWPWLLALLLPLLLIELALANRARL